MSLQIKSSESGLNAESDRTLTNGEIRASLIASRKAHLQLIKRMTTISGELKSSNKSNEDIVRAIEQMTNEIRISMLHSVRHTEKILKLKKSG